MMIRFDSIDSIQFVNGSGCLRMDSGGMFNRQNLFLLARARTLVNILRTPGFDRQVGQGHSGFITRVLLEVMDDGRLFW